ncbi:MAG: hypothetical protein HY669_02830 [Chloroflexi bacterium]|nr:hypothetical protein [Chloroflexota bacterium]
MASTRYNLVGGEGRCLYLQLIVEQWLSPHSRQNTWVYPQDNGLRGLISTRNLRGSHFRQVHRLLLARDDAEACGDLLDQASRHSTDQSVQSIFLRLEHSDALLPAARQAGFHPYLGELLYQAEGIRNPRRTPAPGLRPKVSGDDYLLFQLYCLAVPDSVRRLGALTFAEWSQARERPPVAHSVREFVYYGEGEVRCWLRLHTAARKGLFEIMVHPSQEAKLETMIDFCLDQLRGCNTILSLVPSFQTGLQQVLSDRSFQEVAEYCTLVKQLAPKVTEPSLALLRA